MSHRSPVQFVLLPFGDGLGLHALAPLLFLAVDLVAVGVFAGLRLLLAAALLILLVRHLAAERVSQLVAGVRAGTSLPCLDWLTTEY